MHAKQLLLILGLAALLGSPAMAAQKLEPVETVSVGGNNELMVNGKPFIPLMSWAQNTSRFPLLRSLGFNTFAGNHNRIPPAREFCDLAAEAGGYAMPNFDAAAKGHPALLGYLQPDEPDMGFHRGTPRMTVEEVMDAYKDMKSQDPTRPIWLGSTAYFMVGPSWASSRSPEAKREYYSRELEGGDLLGFDVYPIYGWNRPDKLTWVADGVSQLRAYAGERPVSAAIETCKGSQWITYERQHDVELRHTRAEVWMALIRGARSITYFTHAWRPEFNEFAPTDEMRAELKRLNGQITRLTPAICAPPTERTVVMRMGGGAYYHFMAHDLDGALYIFAQNVDMEGRSGEATISVSGLQEGAKITVVDEDRTITAGENGFSDAFEALAEHIYRVELPPATAQDDEGAEE